MYKADRKTYVDWLLLYQKNQSKPKDEDVLKELVEKLEKQSKPKTGLEKIKEVYSNKGSLPMCDRVTIVSDCEYVGQTIPFLNSPPPDENEENNQDMEGKPKTKKVKLTNPEKINLLKKAPQWKIHPPLPKNQEVLERVNQINTERFDKIKEKFDKYKIDLKRDAMESYKGVKDYKKLRIKYHEPQSKTEEYIKWREENPLKYPGPQHYFTTPLQDFSNKKKKKNDEEEGDNQGEEPQNKNHVDRKKIDKKVYKPLKTHFF